MGALRRWYRTCLTSHSDPATTATATPMALGTTAGTGLLHRLRPTAMATRTARTMAAMAPMAATHMPVATAMATHMPPPIVAMAMATPMAAPTATAAATAMATPMAGATTTRCSSLFVRHEAQLGGRSVGSPRAQLARQWSIV